MKRARRAFLAAALVAACGTRAAGPAGERERLEDFDRLWTAIDEGYAYFAASGRCGWRAARDPLRMRARNARTPEDFIAALEGLLARLRDDHIWMSARAPASPRRVPAETDLWAAWRGTTVVIEAVRTYGEADVAGLRPGHVVSGIGGLPAPLVMRDRLGASETDASARDWALRHALAGPRTGLLRLEVSEARGPRVFEVERHIAPPANGPALIARRVGEARDLGYLRIKAPLSDRSLAARFDGAMHLLGDTRALMLDLRDASGPFDDADRARAATVAILRRFAARPSEWQVREARSGARAADSVATGAGVYRAPLVVLVDRWTAGEGEALAAGLRAIGSARLVGTRMAGLRGELREVRLPHSGISVRFPGEKAYLPDGSPREALQPDLLVDLAAPQGGPGDPILYQALKLLEK